MATKKTIFVAFAIEDERQRDFLKGQSLNTNSPFEYVDMSVKEAYDTDWKNKVRTRIKRSDGVIALISSDSLTKVFSLVPLALLGCRGAWHPIPRASS